MKQAMRLMKLGLIVAGASMLAGCITSTPASVPGLRATVGNTLPEAQGKTLQDQDAIDDTIAGGCAAGIWTRSECARHTAASAERRAELK